MGRRRKSSLSNDATGVLFIIVIVIAAAIFDIPHR